MAIVSLLRSLAARKPSPSRLSALNSNHLLHSSKPSSPLPPIISQLTNPAPTILDALLGPRIALANSGGSMGGSNFGSGSSGSSWSSPSSSGYSSFRSDSPSYTFLDSGGSYYGRRARYGRELTEAEETKLDQAYTMIGGLVIVVVGGVAYLLLKEGGTYERIAIQKIQVGINGTTRTLQKDLNEIAKTANTGMPQGFHYVLTETALALLRQPDYYSAYSSVDVKRSREGAEKQFKNLSIEERAKFDKETLVNLNDVKRSKTASESPMVVNNEYIVVSILVASTGKHKLPAIKSNADVKAALQMLGSIPSNKTLGVEVYWTPQRENDVLTESDLRKDYPLLKRL